MYEDARLLGWKSKKPLTPEQAARLIQDFAPDEEEVEAYEEPLQPQPSIARGLMDWLQGLISLTGVRHA
jgi:hypothetical protein